jgi:hypothetical protein
MANGAGRGRFLVVVDGPAVLALVPPVLHADSVRVTTIQYALRSDVVHKQRFPPNYALPGEFCDEVHSQAAIGLALSPMIVASVPPFCQVSLIFLMKQGWSVTAGNWKLLASRTAESHDRRREYVNIKAR